MTASLGEDDNNLVVTGGTVSYSSSSIGSGGGSQCSLRKDWWSDSLAELMGSHVTHRSHVIQYGKRVGSGGSCGGTKKPEANVKAEGGTKKLKVQSLMKKKRKGQDETAVPAVLAKERHNWQMEEGIGVYQKCIPW